MTPVKITYLSGSIDREALRRLCESIVRNIPKATWQKLATAASRKQKSSSRPYRTKVTA